MATIKPLTNSLALNRSEFHYGGRFLKFASLVP